MATGSAGGVVEPLSLKALTEALDLPDGRGGFRVHFTIRHRPGELSLDGALVISVSTVSCAQPICTFSSLWGAFPGFRQMSSFAISIWDCSPRPLNSVVSRAISMATWPGCNWQAGAPLVSRPGFAAAPAPIHAGSANEPCRISVRSAAVVLRRPSSAASWDFSKVLVTGEWAHRASCAMASACWRVLKG